MIKKLFKKLFLPFTDKTRGHQPDMIMLADLIILAIFGLIILSSASAVVSFQKFNDSYFFLKKQLINGILPGLIFFFFLLHVNYNSLKKWAMPIFTGSLILLILVLIPGVGSNFGGSSRWLNFFGFSFQPSEVVKFAFILYLATWLEKRGERAVRDINQGLLPFLIMMVIVLFLIMKQPDMGTTIVIAMIGFLIYFIAGASWKHTITIFVIGVIAFIAMIVTSPYRFDRMTAFLNTGVDPQGISYHTLQAKIAIGSGGVLGMGLGNSRQKFNYLPEVTGDSIFAVLAEELGLVFSILLILLFLIILIRGLKIARDSQDRYGQLLAVGITAWFCFQSFINIAAMVGLVPLTGIPLPFVSYGGTALAINLAACGLLLNISKFTRKIN